MADKLKAGGHIRVSLEDKSTGERTTLWEGTNAVTQFGKELFLATSASLRMNFLTTIGAGTRLACTTFGDISGQGYYYPSVTGTGLACYLLNLDDETKNSLTPASRAVSLIDGYSLNSDKLVGYGSLARTSSSATEGVVAIPDGDLLVDPTVSARAWRFPAGVATGSFNTIQIGAHFGLNTTTPNWTRGGTVWSGLSVNDIVISDQIQAQGYYLRPGVTKNGEVITKDTEILVGDGTNSVKSRIVYDFVAGTMTYLTSDDVRYDLDLADASFPQYIVGDYLCCVMTYPTVVKMSTWTSTTLATSNLYGKSFFIKDGYVYFATGSSSIFAYNIETGARDSSKNITFSSLGLPSGWSNYSNVSIQNWGGDHASGKYFMQNYVSIREAYGVVCTDYKDMVGTTIEVIPRLPKSSSLTIGGEVYILTNDIGDYSDFTYARTVSGANYVLGKGLWFTKTWGSLLSYRVLDSAITKDADKEIVINYWYQFV
jgi:hypothetical protein